MIEGGGDGKPKAKKIEENCSRIGRVIDDMFTHYATVNLDSAEKNVAIEKLKIEFKKACKKYIEKYWDI